MSNVKREIAGLKIRQQVLYILIFTLVTIIVWVFFSLFLSQKKEASDPQLLQLAKALNPNLDTQIIGELERKRQYVPADLANFVIYKLVLAEDRRSEQKTAIDLR